MHTIVPNGHLERTQGTMITDSSIIWLLAILYEAKIARQWMKLKFPFKISSYSPHVQSVT